MSKELGDRIRTVRQHAGLSAAALAKRAKIDPAALLRIERGDNTNPSFATVARIADALGMPLDDLRSKSVRLRTTDVERIRQEEELAEALRLSVEVVRRLERLHKR